MYLCVQGWCRVSFVAALAVGGCAKPLAPGEDLGHGVFFDGGDGDLAAIAPIDLARPAPDLTPVCGDGVCSAAVGEFCDTCPEDCGACKQCAAGTADCNHDMSDGCETDITTADNCNACGRVCAQVGGTNACVASGGSWVCKPTCDGTHGNCDGDPIDGCETDTTTPSNCSGCGIVCANPHGSTTCASSGNSRVCSPTCAPGWAECDLPGAGCTTDISGSPASCGSCTRACSSTNTTATTCSSGLCTPSCGYPFADCSRPASPAADDGCETNGTVDPGESDNTCNGQYTSTSEGATTTITTNRILPATDVDTFQVHLSEGSHTCFPLTSQPYDARIDVIPPAGVELQLRYNTSSCNNTWTTPSPGATSICYAWTGTCGVTDDRDLYFQVFGNNNANSCLDYTFVVTYATEGNKVAGCP
jgi:hypothetical protein